MSRCVLMFVCLLIVLPASFTVAQDTIPDGAHGWETAQRCVGELPYPALPQDKMDV